MYIKVIKIKKWGRYENYICWIYNTYFNGSYANAENTTTEADLLYNGILWKYNILTSSFETRFETFTRKATPYNDTVIIGGFIQDELAIIE